MAEWSSPAQTIIILDWDDTLFPSSWLFEEHGVSLASKVSALSKNMADELCECSKAALQVLRLATTLAASVIILTLAAPPIVERVIANFAPQLNGVLESLDIKIVYARVVYRVLKKLDKDSVAETVAYSKKEFEKQDEHDRW